jgi:diguanylate cyclase (GGDEF)-like protein
VISLEDAGKSKNMINHIGEFYDSTLEKEYFEEDMHMSVKYIKPIVLALGILNTLFIIPDYYFVTSSNSFKLIAAMRLIFVLLVIVLYLRISYMKTYKVLAYWITIYEITSIIVFLLIFYHYESPDYIVQAMGMIVILLAIFMIPNRWVYTIAASLLGSLGFVVLSRYYIKELAPSKFWAGVVYILITIVILCIYSYRNHYYKRTQYLNKLELIRLSTTDFLTGAYNRAKFDKELLKWIGYAKRYNVPLSVILFDIDNFKRVNDLHGHLTGDKVIVQLVGLVKKSIRESDVFARWGGEEFAIILPSTTKANAIVFAERLRLDIESSEFNGLRDITCSFGVVELLLDDDIDSLMGRSDRMLYSAKSDGKNKVKG